MKNIGNFIIVFALNVCLFWGPYIALKFGLMGFRDPDGLYIALTAFGYTAEILAVCFAMLAVTVQMSRALSDISLWRQIVRSIPFINAFAVLVLSGALFANKVDWWARLMFSGDKYGYYTTRPAVTAILATCACIAMISVSLRWSFSPKVARITTPAISVFILIVSLGAAAFVAGGI